MALREDSGLSQIVLIAGAAAFAVGLLSLGAAWAFGRAPRTRREALLHLLWPGAAAAMASPFVFTLLLRLVAQARGVAITQVPFGSVAATAPLAVYLGLPIALFAGLAFAWVALVKPRDEDLMPPPLSD